MAGSEDEFRNPLRNESDTFRVLLMFFVVAGLVIAAAELVGSWLGIAIALVAIAMGIYATIGWLRVGLGEADEDDSAPQAPGEDVRRPEPDGSGDAPPRP